jgi:2-dehydropantoate 2-reductase
MELQPMRIAVLGVGAMGSVYATFFAEAGHEVWAVDKWAEHVSAINASGLRLSGISGDRFVNSVQAVMDVGTVPKCDLYVIATKGSGVAEAAKAISTVMPSHAMVLAIQNGLGAGAKVSNYLPETAVLLGVADGFGAEIRAPGHAHHNAMKLIRLGEIQGGRTERLDYLEEIWRNAGFNAQAFDDIHQLIWEKYICNVALSGPCTVFKCNIGELLDNSDFRSISIGCLNEAYAAGCAEGIKFSFDDAETYLERFVAMMPDAVPSMRQDHLVGRKSEIEFINGMVPIVAKRHDMVAPYNQTISTIIRRIEEDF